MKKIILKLIKFYQRVPHRTNCRFLPTCSEYAYKAISKYGILKGGILSLKRILKCQPFNPGGADLLN